MRPIYGEVGSKSHAFPFEAIRLARNERSPIGIDDAPPRKCIGVVFRFGADRLADGLAIDVQRDVAIGCDFEAFKAANDFLGLRTFSAHREKSR